MRYQFRSVPLPLLVAFSLFCILIVAFLLGRGAHHLIRSRQVLVVAEQIVQMAPVSCKVEISGDFKYDSVGGGGALQGLLHAELKLINRSNKIFSPRGKFKLGLRWQGASGRADQYRIELPNQIAPGEELYFITRVPLHDWSNLSDILIIELINESAYWCSDYGGMRLVLSKSERGGEIGVTQIKN